MRPRARLKLIRLASALAIHCGVALALHGLPIRRERRARWLARWCSTTARAVSSILGLEARTAYLARPPRPREAQLIVANHLSYVDAILIARELPCIFVTSVEVRDTPGIGWLARISGCLFVDRRSRMQLPAEIERIARTLREGTSVVFFPEGTSTDGVDVLPFKRSLFEASVLAQTPVLALCLQYDAEDRARVSYWGSDRFFPHLLGLLEMKSIRARVELLDRLSPRLFSKHELALEAHVMIRDAHRRLTRVNEASCAPTHSSILSRHPIQHLTNA